MSSINNLPMECLVKIMQELPVVDRENTYQVNRDFQIATLLATIDKCREVLCSLNPKIREQFPQHVKLSLAMNQCEITLAVRYPNYKNKDKQIHTSIMLIAERQRLMNSQEAFMKELNAQLRVSNDKIRALMRNTKV